MKTNFKRIIATFVCAALLFSTLVVSAIPASAISYSGSASYKGGKYYTALSKVTKTGNQRTDVVNVAKSQVGYQESGSSSKLSGEVRGSGNYTEYGRWYGVHTMWCAMFVSWCTSVAGVSTSIAPKHSFTPTGLTWYKNRGQAYTRASVASGKYTPQKGDIIYFKSSRNNNITNHIGIVTNYSGKTVYTIEGNSSSATISTNGGACVSKSYSITNTYIVYICKPAYKGSSSSSSSSSASSNAASISSVKPNTTTGATTYYKKCSSSYTSIVSALNSIGADSSYANRQVIAVTNGITNYSGTPDENIQLLNLLKKGALIKAKGVSSSTSTSTPSTSTSTTTSGSTTYYAKCSSSYTSIVDALKSIGVDSSKTNRTAIAKVNGMSNYTGTPAQNTELLQLLKNGKLIKSVGTTSSSTTTTTTPTVTTTTAATYYPKCKSSYTSLVDALNSIGVDSSKANRAKIAEVNGIKNYTYTPEQNTQILNLLKAGKLIKTAGTTTTTTAKVTYYAKCKSSYTSIVSALNSIGVDSSKTNRAKIAKLNGITNYTYTPAQNIELLDLLKAGKLIKSIG